MKQVTFVGSFPRADFAVTPALPEIALVGRSNVGKSSLVNALVGRKAIARTSKTPGKTRECNVFAVNGHYHLVDLPGYGYAQVSKGERARLGRLIEDYLGRRGPLRGVVWLLDIRREPSADDRRVADLLGEAGRPVLVALTKGDKFGRDRRRERAQALAGTLEIADDQVLVTSSKTGLGIADLRDSLDALIDPPEA